MGNLITITREEKPPMIKCPKCQYVQRIHLNIWENDVTKIWDDKCLGCGHRLYVGILILTHPSLNGILECIQTVIAALKPILMFPKKG